MLIILQSPPAESYWNVRLCLTVPHSIDAPDIAVPGNPAVAFRGKLLIFVSHGLIMMADCNVMLYIHSWSFEGHGHTQDWNWSFQYCMIQWQRVTVLIWQSYNTLQTLLN